jgi:hypothetical protein
MGVKLGSLTLRVFEDRVLRKTFGRYLDEVTEEWRRLHNEEIHDRYSSRGVIQVIVSTKIRWTGYVVCKAVPLQAWSGPEGSRKLRFTD